MFSKDKKSDVTEQVKKSVEELGHIAAEKIASKILDFISSKTQDFVDLFKIMIFYEEKNCPSFSLKDAIRWLKTNLPDKPTIKGAIFLESQSEHYSTLYLFYLDNDEPLLDAGSPHLFVKTIKIEQDLLDLFGKNQLIIYE